MSRVTRHEMIAIRALQLSETTKHFCYRPVAKADAYPLFEVGRHPDFHRSLDWEQPADVDGAMIRVQGLLAQELLNTSASSSIVDKPTGSWAGLLRWVPFRAGLAIELWVRPELWVDGGPGELLNNALSLVYRATSLNDVYALVRKGDERLEQLVKQSGMVKLNAFESSNVYGIDRETFLVHQSEQAYA